MQDTPPKPTILQVVDVRAAYGATVCLHGMHFEIAEGEIVALIGPNGAGKTTALRTISGLLAPLAGDVVYQGKSIAGLRPDEIVKLGIAHCPEERHVWPELTVGENLSLGAYLCKDRHESERRIGMALHRFPRLKERFGQLAGTLSGGEQQMLAIGRALMSEPRLLMLDEPSLGLSPVMAQEVMRIVRELRDHGISILLVEQNVHRALSISDRAYVVETGRVAAHDKSDVLLSKPELLQAYLGT